MDLWLAFDFLIGSGLLAGLIVAVTRMRSARVTARRDGGPGGARRAGRGDREVAVLMTFGPALVLLAFFTVTYIRSANQVISSPTRAQVTGTWVGELITCTARLLHRDVHQVR
jgi:hypothetical protein